MTETLLSIDPHQTCAACGWTAARLRDTGRMGCAACYAAFEIMVIRAVEELHGVSPDPPASPAADPISLPPDRALRPAAPNPFPWPTRRGRKAS